MRHIHPFPARMAPEIALSHLKNIRTGSLVLDPMCGSGMVLNQAARLGISAVGCDLDPLACLVSRTGSTRTKESAVWNAYDDLFRYCKRYKQRTAKLDWIDSDPETLEYVKYWFARKQEKQIRRIARFLFISNPNFASNPKNVLAVALSRLIISKEPKASLARDAAHSRPHRVIDINDFDVLENLEGSVHHVLKALSDSNLLVTAKTYRCDARNLIRIKNSSVDAIITSPPYLNAIDYLRGHRLSLVWFGYSLARLRQIRSDLTGTEAVSRATQHSEFCSLMSELSLTTLSNRSKSLLNKYYVDIRKTLSEAKRVLKKNGKAVFVIGNSSIRGDYIQNNELVKIAAFQSGLVVVDEHVREIPSNKRYLPVLVSESNRLSERMRTEHVVEFALR